MPQISALTAAEVFSNYLALVADTHMRYKNTNRYQDIKHTQSTQEISKHNLRTDRPYLTRLDRSNALKLIPHQAGKSGTKQSISFHEIILIAIDEYNDKDDKNKDHGDDGKTGGKTVMNCIFIIFACKH